MTKTSIHAFRVWDKDKKRYIKDGIQFTHYINMSGNLIRMEWIDNEVWGCEFVKSKHLRTRYKIERFTGFTDKNGRDIYEGDLITHSHSHLKHSVTFSKKLGVIYAQYSEDERAQKMLCVLNDLEVVGTVHD